MILKAHAGRRKPVHSPQETIKDLIQIISAIREAVWLRDAKTRNIIYVNPAYEKLYGQSCQYFRQNPQAFLEVIHPEDKERIKKSIKCQYEGIPFNEEYRIIRADGSTRWINGRSELLLDRKGELDRIFALSEDITKRKESEEALRESEAKFKSLAEHSPSMIFINQKGKIVYTSAKCEEITGYSKEELCSPAFNFLTLIAPEHKDQTKENFRKHANGEDVPPFQYAVVTKSGEKIDSIISTKLIDYEGTKAILGVVTDISKQVRASEELKDSETRFRALFENSREAMSLEKSGIQVLCNRSYLSLYGFKSFDECVGLPTINHVTPDQRGKIDEFTKLRIQGLPAPVLYETRGLRIDGTPFDIEVRVSSYDSLGETFTLVTIVDITERKRAEKALIESLKEKDVLLREIHHRVKNNMQIISSLLRLQAGQLEDESAKTIFQSCQDRIRSMSLVHEKLYISENLSGINFFDYINSLALRLFQIYKVNPDLIQLKLNVKEVFFDLQTAIPCGLILNELISNALKYAFPNGRKGEIEISLAARADDAYQLIVKDDGIGFPKEEDFENPKSFGIQIVKLLAGQLGGEALLKKSPGTTFEITFKDPLYKQRIF
jgi:PAS domain S-box-containing protein